MLFSGDGVLETVVANGRGEILPLPDESRKVLPDYGKIEILYIAIFTIRQQYTWCEKPTYKTVPHTHYVKCYKCVIIFESNKIKYDIIIL